jgi:enoyl-[acyl-carrier protein] reductase I
MGILDGKKALIFGVANDHSIAWGIAQAFHEQGATVGFSSIADLLERRVKPLADSLGSTFVEPCDVQNDDDIVDVFAKWQAQYGTLDILVHSMAFAHRDDLAATFVNTSRDGFKMALDISAYSLVALTKHALPLLHDGSSVMAMTYYGSEKVVPHYNVMGVAKAALEAAVRYLAADLGPQNIRVNAISAGPVKTAAARGIKDFAKVLEAVEAHAPLRRNVTPGEVADMAVFLASDLGRGVTGNVLFVDAGYQVMGF